MRDPPGVFGVERETLNILRKVAVVGGSGGSTAREVNRKLGRVCDIVLWVLRKLINCFLVPWKCAAEHGFVDEVDAELERMTSGNMAQVVAKLVFVLIAQVGEKRNRSGELVVAEGFEAGNGQRGGAEGEGQREAQI